MDGINSNKTLNEAKQLCVGHKLELTEPIFYEYEGEVPREIKFEKMKRIENYKSSRGNVSVCMFLNKNRFLTCSLFLA